MHSPKKLRWGILGLGNIARHFCRDLKAYGIPIQAAASRSLEHAQAFAQEFAIPIAYGSYDDLLADPTIDCVYVALPNSLHAQWTVAAARAGKSILCEKPFAGSPDVVETTLREVEAAGGFFMEGFMYRCHPQWNRVHSILQSGLLGEIRLLESRFSYNLGQNQDNIRLKSALEGGSLMDVGCYCVNFSRWVLKTEPIQFQAMGTLGKSSDVDEWFTGAMRFEAGAQAVFQCGARVQQPSWAAIYGEKGRIEIPEPWKPDPDRAVIRLVRGSEVETFTEGDGQPLFAREALVVEAAIQAGQKESPIMPWAESIRQACAMLEVRKAAGFV